MLHFLREREHIHSIRIHKPLQVLQHIQLQILQYGIFDFFSITKKRIELYNENTNTIFDIDILLPRDEKYITIINNNKYSMKIQLVQFENFSRIVNVL